MGNILKATGQAHLGHGERAFAMQRGCRPQSHLIEQPHVAAAKKFVDEARCAALADSKQTRQFGQLGRAPVTLMKKSLDEQLAMLRPAGAPALAIRTSPSERNLLGPTGLAVAPVLTSTGRDMA